MLVPPVRSPSALSLRHFQAQVPGSEGPAQRPLRIVESGSLLPRTDVFPLLGPR
jgi:hypothetical protein